MIFYENVAVSSFQAFVFSVFFEIASMSLMSAVKLFSIYIYIYIYINIYIYIVATTIRSKADVYIYVAFTSLLNNTNRIVGT